MIIKEHLNPLRWRRSVLIATLVGFFAVWFLFIDTYSLTTRVQLELRKGELTDKTEELHKQTEDLREKIEHLESNPDLLEKIAREEYGMRKPGETVYRIKSEE
ncbi:MAG: septum formation initiator family protein [Balneolaceae bacterium]|nr:septum formation initiator family protein [Balneolaceae bacterium]MCH8548691.1 septum formation initiator family protein [Balneolaceae bacterium]